MASTDLYERFVGAAGALLSDHTSDSGHTWSSVGISAASGVLLSGLGNGRLYNPGSSSGVALRSSWVPASPDYMTIVKVANLGQGSAAQDFGIQHRASGTGGVDGYWWQVQPGLGFQVLKHTPSGGYLQLGSTVAGSFLDADELRYVVTGTGPVNLTVTQVTAGVPTVLFSLTDTTDLITAAGSVQLIVLGSQTTLTGYQFDTLWAGPAAGPSSTISPTSATLAHSATQAFTDTGYAGLSGVSPALVYTFTASTGTFSSGIGVAGATYTAPTSGTSDVVTATNVDLSLLTATAAITLTSPTATAYTLAPPSPASGFVGNASSNLTAQANGVPSVSLIVTPSDGSGGTFAPTSLTIADAATHTFTYTPSSAGSKSVATTHTGGGFSGDPSSVSYTASARTLAASPATIATSTTTTVSLTGGGTKWLTTPPTFGSPGLAGASFGSVTVTTDTACSLPVTTGSTAGTITLTDSTSSATATVSAASITTTTIYDSTNPGLAYTGLVGTFGLAWIDAETDEVVQARSTAGITEYTPGIYKGSYANAVLGKSYFSAWDSGGSSPTYRDGGQVPARGGLTVAQVEAAVAVGLDQISVADPGPASGHTTLSRMLVATYRALWKKSTQTSSQWKRYADDGATVNSASTTSDDGTTQTIGAFP